MRVAAYVRVSTAGQNEASQRCEIEKWLNGHGVHDVTWFVDKKSGDDLQRPAFEKLQAAVFNGVVDTIVVYKLDRISRKLRDGINTLCDWCKAGIRVVSVTQQLDFTGATGQLVAAVLFAVAQMEQETRRERQADGIAVAKEAGKYRGRKPGSFTVSLEEIHTLKAKGRTAAEIAKLLNVAESTVWRHLGNAKAIA